MWLVSNTFHLSFPVMEATSGKESESHSPGERSSKDTFMHVSYDSDLEITDKSEDADYCLGNEEIEDSSISEDNVGDMELPGIVLIIKKN